MTAPHGSTTQELTPFQLRLLDELNPIAAQYVTSAAAPEPGDPRQRRQAPSTTRWAVRGVASLAAAAAALATLGTGAGLVIESRTPAAAAMLEAAADKIITGSDPVLRPGQFLHRSARITNSVDGSAVTWEVWIPADRSRTWVVRTVSDEPEQGRNVSVDRAPGGRYDGWQAGGWGSPTTAFVEGLPRDPEQLLAKARRELGDDEGVAFFLQRALVEPSVYPSAPVRAALLRALAKLPGAVIADEEVTVAGRTGVAVRLRFDNPLMLAVNTLTRPGTQDIVIDPATGDLIAERSTDSDGNTVVSSFSVDIADRAP